VSTRVVLVPGVLALLPGYAGLTDPVAGLRAACHAAVSWLGPDPTVLGDPQGARVARSLLAAAPPTGRAEASYLVVGNGSARRSEKAPGHLDDRAHDHDAALGAWLRGTGPRPDPALSRELLAATDGLDELAALGPWDEPVTDYDDDPYGVQYWVLRWELAGSGPPG